MICSKHVGRAVSLLVLLPLALTAQVARQADNMVPLKNWATPLYWQPKQAETQASGKALPQLQFSANAVSADALTFIAITPCRLVDTRGAAAGFNGMDPFAGPSIAAKGTLTVPVQSPTEATANTTPAPCGVIPSIAQAYSFNLTVVPTRGARSIMCRCGPPAVHNPSSRPSTIRRARSWPTRLLSRPAQVAA